MRSRDKNASWRCQDGLVTTREWIVIGQKFEVQTCRRPATWRTATPAPQPKSGAEEVWLEWAISGSGQLPTKLEGAVTAGLGTETADWPPSPACGTALSGPRGRI